MYKSSAECRLKSLPPTTPKIPTTNHGSRTAAARLLLGQKALGERFDGARVVKRVLVRLVPAVRLVRPDLRQPPPIVVREQALVCRASVPKRIADRCHAACSFWGMDSKATMQSKASVIYSITPQIEHSKQWHCYQTQDRHFCVRSLSKKCVLVHSRGQAWQHCASRVAKLRGCQHNVAVERAACLHSTHAQARVRARQRVRTFVHVVYVCSELHGTKKRIQLPRAQAVREPFRCTQLRNAPHECLS